ncbi:2-keto-4-pentenoate hydratase [Aneurinibacillus aneurinilyticus]|jgi:2-oxo-3-hexenedioate decarboxylase|uniref:2-keto-4-pentenoate hydratase n=1 Tax=Aneurinibacillus aneurinilyticus TaxID=1391 RepID=UPI0023F8E76D|nr:fumarylacetoacetate hydrolase family protein [Aneurinibacillus aneurinilyticus]MCI1696529.1 4-oxalocrotonate decarboxylase [Aneurinibacillus aneurinilyticus]
MILTDTVEAIAEELFTAEAKIQEIDTFIHRYPELDAALAYKVQERLIEMKCERQKTHVRGHKLGLTSVAKQKMMGVHEPLYGVLLNDMELDQQEPISLQPFIHAKIEPEIAFVLERDIKGPISVPEVLAATAYVIPAFEIIDSRYRNFKFTLPDVIADNASSSRFILGDRIRKTDGLDLKVTGTVFKKNGQVIATGTGASVMGHPARAVAWMVNKLAARDQYVKAGEVVLSGALTEAFRIEENDVFSVGFDGLGVVQAIFTT